MKQKILPHNHILVWILVPVVAVGVSISAFLIIRLSPPMVSFLTQHFDANLRLASGLALEKCEDSLSYLLDLRLEDSPDMNSALRREALEEIKAISRRVPETEMAVVDANGQIMVASIDYPQRAWELPPLVKGNDAIVTLHVAGDAANAHVRYFPFWDWYLVSFTFQSHYRAPVAHAERVIYLSTFGVFVAVSLTLIAAFYGFIHPPFRRLIAATEGVSEGKLQRMENVSHNEFGRLMTSFNLMIESLEKEQAEVRSLILQLRVSEHRFRALFDNAPVGICIARPNGSVIEINESMQNIIGRAGSDTEGVMLQELFADQEDGRALLAELEGDVHSRRMETSLKHSSGSTCEVRLMVNRVRLEEEDLLFAIIEDITEQKSLEEQLKQTRKMEAIGNLAGGVAHDFNNLLTPILGYGDILLEDLGNGDPRCTPVSEILTAARRAKEIVRQLLAFSRKQTLEYKAVDLNEVVRDFQKLLRRTIRENIEIRLALAPEVKTVFADTGQIDQVIMNLAVNAQDAMPSGGCMTVETADTELDEGYSAAHPGVRPGEYVMLAISDNGCGMGRETLDRIFEPFFSTKFEHGTGLGLATVYGIVKQHDGYIWVYSEPDRGTVFKVYLPVSEAAPFDQLDPESPRSESEGGSETILLAEDSEQVRKLARTILERRGYTVLAARNGQEALAILDSPETHVDLLLTDVVMPGMNGKELYGEALARRPGLQVLYMSGYTDEVIAHSGVLDRDVEFMPKPFNAKALVTRVRSILDRG